MSVPVIHNSRKWICDKDPTLSESTGFSQSGLNNAPIEKYDLWINSITNDIFICINDIPESLMFQKFSSSSNIQNFNPLIAGSTIPGNGIYSTQIGIYEKIGNQIFITINLTWSGHTGTGVMTIINLPYSTSIPQIGNITLESIPLPLLSLTTKALILGTTIVIKTDIANSIQSNVLMNSLGSLKLRMSYSI